MEGLSLDQVPAYPTNPIRVIESGGRVEEYQITMTQYQVESVGRITENGSILAQSTIKASWDSTGVVTITP